MSDKLSAGNMEYISSSESSSSERVLSLLARCKKQCMSKLNPVAITDDAPAATTRKKLISNLILDLIPVSFSDTSSRILVTQ